MRPMHGGCGAERAGNDAMEAVEERIFARVDAAIHLTALLVRAGVYGFVGSLANQVDCGLALLTGVLVGDLAASCVGLVLRRDHIAAWLAELALLGIVFLWVRGDLVWPHEPAMRAILGLAAFGVFTSRAGGTAFTRLGATGDLA